MQRKEIIGKAIALSCGLVVGYYIIFGPQGFHDYIKLKISINKQHKAIQRLEHDLAYLDTATTQYAQNPFIAEHIARYDLSLGLTNELVYLLPS